MLNSISVYQDTLFVVSFPSLLMKFFGLRPLKVWFIRLKFKIYKIELVIHNLSFWLIVTGYFWNLEMLLLTECVSHISISFLYSTAVHVHKHMSLLW